ncbi:MULTISPECIES: hypothetical protein [unclassified Cryobacterium]|uniref:hypothetical protein n=2 Tax=Bacteria TaxID=2 RepID=UPI002AB4D149|nr:MULTISPECIES: hypothetical protein [unclassified Cryobacterium]MDY7526486.1 hypothetical protein [Cryobacterium sp. 10C2]MDY7557706.1 hypothetical protein [Cryobacterium sp. 10C3]MEB0201622.1 hypothetical protein [Cryobacterium sp. 5I3]MEB0289844.1 hypothetical protein [Cryobacterium sp. 10C2]WPX13941.1 hypothetical protein RHM57_00770 [Cryobacterium sp. 10S3]
MARNVRHVPRDSSRRRVWVYVGVAAFILFDILLILWAINSTRATASGSAPRPIPTYTTAPATPVATPTATPRPTPTAGADSAGIVPVPATRILSAVSATTAWRASTGACPATAATPELTTDSGATWASTDATGPTKVTAVQSLSATSATTVTLIGLTAAGCAPEVVKTFVSGDNYKAYPEQVGTSWYVNPANRAVVHAPAGQHPAPCDAVVSLAPRSDTAAAALCGDGRLFTTTDAAVTWSTPATLPGAIALAPATSGYLVVSAGRPECAGAQLLTVTDALVPTVAGCYAVSTPSTAMAGTVAVSEAAGTIWLWAGEQVVRSTDSGATFK